ncbi:MAG TPA: hypothetical protein GX509_00030 [Firmicutes bacterium]|nr:hypothetical protein [Bacillota bacterium]HHY97110.1 hypothetical protein [Bacillota bacterium]
MRRLRLIRGLILILIIVAISVALFDMPTCAQETGSIPGADSAIAATSASNGEPTGIPESYADLKALYVATLQRLVELEKAYQEALDLARGYRSDWEDQRAIAEARKSQVEEMTRINETLMGIIKELRDTINKQHEVIMKLTEKRSPIGFSAGLSLQPRMTDDGGISFHPGFTFGVLLVP